MVVKVYMTSVSGSLEIKKQQERIFSVLASHKIPFEPVDIAQNSEDKNSMREKSGKPKALPPQIFNGDVYCGGFDEFENAIEAEQLNKFLKL